MATETAILVMLPVSVLNELLRTGTVDACVLLSDHDQHASYRDLERAKPSSDVSKNMD